MKRLDKQRHNQMQAGRLKAWRHTGRQEGRKEKQTRGT